MNNIRNRRGMQLCPAVRPLLFALLLLTVSAMNSSCTGVREHTRIMLDRTGDTLTVDLDPESSSRWWPSRDSLVIDCPTCDAETNHIWEDFAESDRMQIAIEPSQTLTFSIYRNGMLDSSFVLAGIADPAGSADATRKYRLRNLNKSRRNTAASPASPTMPKAKETVKTVKKSTTLTVTAAEGIAVYKDKSKQQVIKILPKGTTLKLLAREGDLYSVIIDGSEGFVEADAVQVGQ